MGGRFTRLQRQPLIFRNRILKRDELSLNRCLIPFVPAEAGTQFFGRVLGPWIPALAGMNGDWFNGGANLNLAVGPRRTTRYSARQIDHGLALQALKEIEAAAVGPRSARQHRKPAERAALRAVGDFGGGWHDGHCRARPRPERLSRSFQRSHDWYCRRAAAPWRVLAVRQGLDNPGQIHLEVDQRRAENCRRQPFPVVPFAAFLFIGHQVHA